MKIMNLIKFYLTIKIADMIFGIVLIIFLGVMFFSTMINNKEDIQTKNYNEIIAILKKENIDTTMFEEINKEIIEKEAPTIIEESLKKIKEEAK